jgi:hypothetical protein
VGKALARRELAALLEHGELLVGRVAHARLQHPEALHQRQHLAPIGAKGLGIRIDLGLYDGHQLSSRGLSPGSIHPRAPQ